MKDFSIKTEQISQKSFKTKRRGLNKPFKDWSKHRTPNRGEPLEEKEMKDFYCEDCGVPEDLHIRAVNTIYDIETKTLRTETIYLCTKCKDERKEV